MVKPATVSFRIAFSLLLILALLNACMWRPGESRTIGPKLQPADEGNKLQPTRLRDTNSSSYGDDQEVDDTSAAPACSYREQCKSYCHAMNPYLSYFCGSDGLCFCSLC